MALADVEASRLPRLAAASTAPDGIIDLRFKKNQRRHRRIRAAKRMTRVLRGMLPAAESNSSSKSCSCFLRLVLFSVR